MLTVPVDHCTEAYGLALKHQHGWKIVYSGDTRPCPELIEAGKSVHRTQQHTPQQSLSLLIGQAYQKERAIKFSSLTKIVWLLLLA